VNGPVARDRDAAASKAGAANELRATARPRWRSGQSMDAGSVCPRAYRVCRAGFAGRDMQVVRAPQRRTLAFGPDPRRSLGSVS